MLYCILDSYFCRNILLKIYKLEEAPKLLRLRKNLALSLLEILARNLYLEDAVCNRVGSDGTALSVTLYVAITYWVCDILQLLE